MSIREHVQRSDLGAAVTLFELDLTQFGEGVLRFTSAVDSAVAISFGGLTYSPYPIEADGFELTGSGPLPQPTLRVSNVSNLFTALVEQNNDLEGARLRRIRTYARYLDTGPEPDPAATRPIDTYILAQKIQDDNEAIGWRCVSLIDQEGVRLPGRPAIRDFCKRDVRRWNGTSFDYSLATCPYTGDPKDEDGNDCDPEDEVFSKRLTTCCQARFGANAVLPTWAFPGMARLRRR